jgi:hypothetical protein
LKNLKSSISNLQLLHFLMRRVLAANAAELFQLQALGHGLPVLGGRIVPLFAIAALQGNDLSGHKQAPTFWLLASSFLRTENREPETDHWFLILSSLGRVETQLYTEPSY